MCYLGNGVYGSELLEERSVQECVAKGTGVKEQTQKEQSPPTPTQEGQESASISKQNLKV